MPANSMRLSLVAKLLSKGLSSVVKILREGGYSVEIKPNSQVNQEQLEFLAKRCNTPSLIKNFSPDNKSTSSPISTGLPGLRVIGKIDLNARTDSSHSKTNDSINKTPLTKPLDVLKEIETIRKKIGIPNFIYKYYTINSHFINSLKNNYLYLNKPSNFNDPFDCSTKLIDFVGSDHQYTAYLKKLGQFNVSDITSAQIQEIKEHYKNALEEAVGNVGILPTFR